MIYFYNLFAKIYTVSWCPLIQISCILHILVTEWLISIVITLFKINSSFIFKTSTFFKTSCFITLLLDWSPQVVGLNSFVLFGYLKIYRVNSNGSDFLFSLFLTFFGLSQNLWLPYGICIVVHLLPSGVSYPLSLFLINFYIPDLWGM